MSIADLCQPLTTAQAAARVRVSPATIRKWASRGRLQPIKIQGIKGNRYRELDVLLAEKNTRRADRTGRARGGRMSA